MTRVLSNRPRYDTNGSILLSGVSTGGKHNGVMFEASVPFLQPSAAYTPDTLTEKDFDPDVLDVQPPSSLTSARPTSMLTKLTGWPGLVILAQLGLQAVGWGFFAVVKARGEIGLKPSAALWVKNNGHLVTLLATLISTILAGCSSLCRILTCHPEVDGAISASPDVPWNTRRKREDFDAFCDLPQAQLEMANCLPLLLYNDGDSDIRARLQRKIILLWSTLITPVPIVISTPLYGSELDLASPHLQAMQDVNGLDNCVIGNNFHQHLLVNLHSVNAGQTESGYGAARSYIGAPSIINLMDQTYNVSTGMNCGILPARLEDVDLTSWFASMNESVIIPANIDFTSKTHPGGLATNYSVMQQGFTAEISCNFQNLTNDTIPNLSIVGDNVTSWGYLNTTEYAMWYLGFTTNCPWKHSWAGVDWTSVYTNADMNFLVMVGCNTTVEDYTLILVSGGIYSWLPTTVCKMTPKITNVSVDYAGTINVAKDPHGVSQTLDSAAGVSAMYAISNLLTATQATSVNSIGEQWNAMQSQPNWDDEKTLRMLVSTFRIQTMGWTYISGTTRWVLIPGTLIALATIAVVLIAIHRHEGDIPREADPFDLSNPLHLMAAAAGGGLNETLRGGLNSKAMQRKEKINVILTNIPGQGPALVRADEYRPVFKETFSPRSPYSPDGRID
ncbi:hypothetical protein C8R43DRAFT_946079 [Mycena crocata]|nr:hypothetical protein C8R43DRAFT_946079 [Mycena crocata]